MHSDWSITQNINKRADWLTLFALVVGFRSHLFNQFGGKSFSKIVQRHKFECIVDLR